MKIILMDFKFNGLVANRQFAKFRLPPNFVVIWYVAPCNIYDTKQFLVWKFPPPSVQWNLSYPDPIYPDSQLIQIRK